MKNRYPKRCADCDCYVRAGAGLLLKKQSGRWIVVCFECAGEQPETGEDLSPDDVISDFEFNLTQERDY